ncbi:hypothetical protein Pelo_4037 [Pelomyxa schiedti]|nr:hypothetical protein Pelo_4037 [Pelomyxa schiedti]
MSVLSITERAGDLADTHDKIFKAIANTARLYQLFYRRHDTLGRVDGLCTNARVVTKLALIFGSGSCLMRLKKPEENSGILPRLHNAARVSEFLADLTEWLSLFKRMGYLNKLEQRTIDSLAFIFTMFALMHTLAVDLHVFTQGPCHSKNPKKIGRAMASFIGHDLKPITDVTEVCMDMSSSPSDTARALVGLFTSMLGLVQKYMPYLVSRFKSVTSSD